MKLSFTVLVLFLTLLGWAQVDSVFTCRGNVRTMQGDPLSGAHIKSTKTNMGVVANDNGSFLIQLPNADSIEIWFMGYSSIVVPCSNTDSIYFLPRDTLTLPVTTFQPYPTREEFSEAFLKLRLAKDTRFVVTDPRVNRPLLNPTPPEPTLANPLSSLHQFISKEVNKLPKRRTAKILPKWE